MKTFVIHYNNLNSNYSLKQVFKINSHKIRVFIIQNPRIQIVTMINNMDMLMTHSNEDQDDKKEFK